MKRAVKAHIVLLLPWLIFLMAFAFFLTVISPGLGWFDTGELIAASHGLGVSHPPGQPFYTLLVKAATFLPFGSIAFRANLLSALAAALALSLIFIFWRLMMRTVGRRTGDHPWPTLILGGIICVALVLNPVVLDQALRAEVYGPCLTLSMGAYICLGRWRLGQDDSRPLYLAALLLGFNMALHPLLALMAMAPAALFLPAVRPRWPAPGPASLALLFFILGMALYLYLPLAASRSAEINWGAPDNWGRFLAVVTARDYQSSFDGAGLPFAERFSAHISFFGSKMSWLLFILGALGAILLLVREWRTGLLISVALLLNLGVSLVHKHFFPDNPDRGGYLLISFVLLFLSAFSLYALLLRRLCRRPLLAALLALGGVSLLFNLPAPRSRTGERLPSVYAWAASGELPHKSALVAGSDHLVFPLMYIQIAERARPDVALVIEGMMSAPWYLKSLKKRHPELYVPFIDDGRRGRIRERFFQNNRWRPIATEDPHGAALNTGLLFLRGAVAAESSGLSLFESAYDQGRFTVDSPSARIRRRIHLKRADYFSMKGKPLEILSALAASVGGLPGDIHGAFKSRVLSHKAGLPSRWADHEHKAVPLVRLRRGFIAEQSNALLRLAAFLSAYGLKDEARKLILHEVMSGVPEAYVMLAGEYGRAKAPRRALAVITALERRQPRFATAAKLALAFQFRLQGYPVLALALSKEVLKVRPREARAHFLAGLLYGDQGALKQSENHFLIAWRLNRRRADPLVAFAVVCLKFHHHSKARQLLRRALRWEPGNPRARALIGKIKPPPR